jgi:hypothetical protein
MKICFLKLLFILSICLNCHLYGQDRREGYSTNIGVGYFCGNLGPMLEPSIAIKDLNILGEIYFNYSFFYNWELF